MYIMVEICGGVIINKSKEVKINRRNKYILLSLIAAAVGLGFFTFLSRSIFNASTQPITYFVATTGSDSNPGTSDAPFATITKARDKISAAGQKGVTVYVRSGEYDLAAPVTFTSADSGTASAPNIYTNYPGESPVFKGSRSITTTVGDAGIKNYTLNKTSFPNIDLTHVPQVFFNGIRQDTARYPNNVQPNLAVSDPFADYYLQAAATQPDCTNKSVAVGNIIYFDPAKINTTGWDLTNYTIQVKVWTASDPSGIYTAIIRPVASIDQAAGKIMMGTITNGAYSPLNANFAICKGNVFYLQGSPNLIDKSGEFAYNNTTRELKVNLPKVLANTDRLSIPTFVGAAFKVSSASNIQFHGLEIAEVDGDGLFIASSQNIVADGLVVHGVIGNNRGNEQGAPTPSGIEGDAVGVLTSSSITVKNSSLYDAPTNRGVSLMSSDARIKALTKSNDQIINNEIYDVSWRGGIWTDEYGVTMQHNYIHDLSNTAISGNLTLDDISYNRIENVDSNVCDAGAIYMHGAGSFIQARNNKIHDNFIRSAGGYCYSIPTSTHFSRASIWAIYLDNTASYNQIYNNIVVDAVNCGIQNSGWGNSWKNNICIANQGLNGTGYTLNGDMSSYYASAYAVVQNMGTNGYDVAAYQTAFPDLKTLPATWDSSYYQRNLDFENNVTLGSLGNGGTSWTTGRSAIYFRGINYSGSTVIKNDIYFDPNLAGAAFKGGGFYPFTPAGCVLPYGTPPTNCQYDYKIWDIADWQLHNFDTNGGKAAVANPLFVQTSIPTDATHPFSDNFSLQTISPAIVLGFVNINKSQIGLTVAPALASPTTPPKSPAPTAAPAIVKLTGAKLTICQTKEATISSRSNSLIKQVALYEQGFTDIAKATEKYYLTTGVNTENYDSLVADVTAKQIVADTALSSSQSDITAFSCTSSNPKAQLTQFKTDIQLAKGALENYRTSIKNLIMAVIKAK